MAKCERCFHNKVCIDGANYKNSENCKHFKDKDLIEELPCKVGDELFEISAGLIYAWEITKITIYSKDDIDFTCIEKNFSESGYEYEDDFMISNIGKTVFVTEEEAEQALKQIRKE